MPIISGVRKRSVSLRAQVVFIYAVLTLGAATMVYPFLVMISGSVKSRVDSMYFDVVPRYFFDDGMLFKKFQESRYNEDVQLYNSCTGAGVLGFKEVTPPGRVNRVLLGEWDAFLRDADMPTCFYQLGQASAISDGFMPLIVRKYIEYSARCFNYDLTAHNRAFNSTDTAWFYIRPYRERYIDKRYLPDDNDAYRFFVKFKTAQDKWHRVYMSMENMYRYNFLALKYGFFIGDYNKPHHTEYKSYDDVILTERVPADRLEREDWIEFVRENLNRVFVEADHEGLADYRAMLRAKYDDNISKLNRSYSSNYPSFGDVPFPARKDTVGAALVDFDLFVKNCKPEYLRLTGPDLLFKKYLSNKYADIADLNRAMGTSYASFSAVGIPAVEADWAAMQARRHAVKWEFACRNYQMVLSYILLHGRGILNTAVFCLLSVIIALTVNPASAYAMSRHNLPSTYKILLFMMATTAFPSAVTVIPNFLLLKQLHLLNTFWALVLPGMASGYSIFLLKGFFDSLPRELYEAAMMDGAGEWTMFWKVTMSLSRPILAVLALGAFTAAYGTFMYAFTVCQDQKMWTLMVWLFNLQLGGAHMAVTYAGLIIAAVPTLVVFVFSQNVIMRGIIVPQEK